MHLPAHLPGPLRAAVGLVATAADEAKHLPDRAIELPMLAVSTALQLSLRAQQRYAQLTVRGDEALTRGATSDEAPGWATFDDPVDPPHIDVPQPGAVADESSVTAADDDPAVAPISGSGPVPADADTRPPPTLPDGKGVSVPRHAPPSRFDTIGDE